MITSSVVAYLNLGVSGEYEMTATLDQINLNDLYIGYFGDICIDQYGDILDTFTFEDERDIRGISLKQEIITRVESSTLDWQLYPEIGANLKELIGTEANLRWVIMEGTRKIRSALTNDNLISSDSFEISPLVLSLDSVLFVIKVKLISSDVVSISFNYDLQDNQFRHLMA